MENRQRIYIGIFICTVGMYLGKSVEAVTSSNSKSQYPQFYTVEALLDDEDHLVDFITMETKTDKIPTAETSSSKILSRQNAKKSMDNELGTYDFEYQIQGGGNFFGHAEKRTGRETNGQYFVILPDFRRQVVKYYVDSTGYHATVTYEPITSVHGKNINLIPDINPALLHSPRKRKSYKKIVRRRVPKGRRSDD